MRSSDDRGENDTLLPKSVDRQVVGQSSKDGRVVMDDTGRMSKTAKQGTKDDKGSSESHKGMMETGSKDEELFVPSGGHPSSVLNQQFLERVERGIGRF